MPKLTNRELLTKLQLLSEGQLDDTVSVFDSSDMEGFGLLGVGLVGENGSRPELARCEHTAALNAQWLDDAAGEIADNVNTIWDNGQFYLVI